MIRIKSGLNIKQEFDGYLIAVQDNLEGKGFEIDKSVIAGIIIDEIYRNFRAYNGSMEDRLGDPKNIAQKLLQENNRSWPVNNWYPSEIKFEQFKSRNLMKSFVIMRSILFIQFLLAAFALIGSVVLIRGIFDGTTNDNTDAFQSYANFHLLYIYPAFVILIYLGISKISKNTNLRAGVADMHNWKQKIVYTSWIHTFSYVIFCLYLIFGSITPDINAVEQKYKSPSNEVSFTLAIPLVVVSVFFFKMGLTVLDKRVDGSLLVASNGAPEVPQIKWLLKIVRLGFRLMNLGVVILFVTALRFMQEVLEDDFTHINGLGIPMLIGLILYVLFNGLFLILYRAIEDSHKTEISKFVIKSNIVTSILWLIFIGFYIWIMFTLYNSFNLEPSLISYLVDERGILFTPLVAVFYPLSLYFLYRLTLRKQRVAIPEI